jgi:membrane protein YdbS with pleckstrin-like domain
MNEESSQTQNSDDDYVFRGKRSDENVVLVVKQHPWILMPILWFWLVLIGIIVAVLWYFGASTVTSYALGILGTIGIIYSIYQWFLWNNGIYVLTDQRVIRIEQNGLFSREISETELNRIQEISTEISGPIRTLLNFGNVRIQTASSSGRLDLGDVVDPYDIQQQIVRIQREQPTGETSVKTRQSNILR